MVRKEKSAGSAWLSERRLQKGCMDWGVFHVWRSGPYASLRKSEHRFATFPQKAGWIYKGEVDESLSPNGKGKLFKTVNNRLLYSGLFEKGKVVVWDLVRQIKNDEKVLRFLKMFGNEGICYSHHGILSACERGEYRTCTP